MKIFGWLFLLCSVLAAQAEIDGLLRSFRLTERILIVGTGEMGMDMVAAIKTRRGIVVIDTGMAPSLTKKHRAVIEKTFNRSDFAFIVNTHHHGDHVNGNQVFKDAVIIAHKNAAAQMKGDSDPKKINEYVEYIRTKNIRRNRLKETLRIDSLMYKNLRDRIVVSNIMCNDYESIYQATLPSLTFTDHLVMDMGDMSIELFYFGPGFHSDGDIIVSIPEENAVFTGDIIFPRDRYQFVTATSDIRTWVGCLEKVFKNNPDIKHVVAYHIGVKPVAILKDFFETLKKMGNIQQQKGSAIDVLKEMISASGVGQAVKNFQERFVKKNDDRYYIWEGDLLSISMEYLEKEKYVDALIILKLAEKLFPDSSRPLFHQARIFTRQRKKQLAIKTYRKILPMDPDNYYYAELIFQLKNNP